MRCPVWGVPARHLREGRFEGREAVRKWFSEWFERNPEIHFTIKHLSVEKTMAISGTNAVHAEWDLDETDREGNAYHLTG